MRNMFCCLFGEENVLTDELMSKHTTFHIGGKADYFIKIRNSEDIVKALKVCKENNLPVFILGNGSNILVGDKGIRGVVLQLEKDFQNIEINKENRIINAEAGILLTKLANVALSEKLSGLECISGIPGTLGGAIYMNAGAYGDEIANHIVDVTYIDEEQNIKTISKDECLFGYRKSFFTDTKNVIISARIKLEEGRYEEIKEKMAEHTKLRTTKQPIEKFSAGSTFKRPEGNFAGTLIEKAGLKGNKIGGAEVSEKHAGFIINNGTATADDVLSLVEYVKDKVFEMSGIMLEPEIKKIGEFKEAK